MTSVTYIIPYVHAKHCTTELTSSTLHAAVGPVVAHNRSFHNAAIRQTYAAHVG